MDGVRDCTECSNIKRCLKLIKEGKVPYCGSSLCKPIHKEETIDERKNRTRTN